MKKRYFILSILGLMNVIFIPIFDVWGGLFPSNPDWDFIEVVEEIFTNENAWEKWAVIFTTAIFVPCLLMLISSFCNSRKAFLISSIIGFTAEACVIFEYIDQNDPTDYIPSDDCNIAIGVWIALVLFFVSIFVGFKKYEQQLPTINTIDSNAETRIIQQSEKQFCSKCGCETEAGAKFCDNCGNDLSVI